MIDTNFIEGTRIPIYKKPFFSINEAADYFNIGREKLYQIVNNCEEEDFILKVGKKRLIKRKLFEEFLNRQNEI